MATLETEIERLTEFGQTAGFCGDHGPEATFWREARGGCISFRFVEGKPYIDVTLLDGPNPFAGKAVIMGTELMDPKNARPKRRVRFHLSSAEVLE